MKLVISIHLHSLQHRTWGITVLRPNRCSPFGSITHSVNSPPCDSMLWARASSCFSFNRFSIECATDFSSSSSALSVGLPVSLWTRYFQRRFTSNDLLDRNIQHWVSISTLAPIVQVCLDIFHLMNECIQIWVKSTKRMSYKPFYFIRNKTLSIYYKFTFEVSCLWSLTKMNIQYYFFTVTQFCKGKLYISHVMYIVPNNRVDLIGTVLCTISLIITETILQYMAKYPRTWKYLIIHKMKKNPERKLWQ